MLSRTSARIARCRRETQLIGQPGTEHRLEENVIDVEVSHAPLLGSESEKFTLELREQVGPPARTCHNTIPSQLESVEAKRNERINLCINITP